MNNLCTLPEFYEMEYGHHVIGECCNFVSSIQTVLNEKAKRTVPFNAGCRIVA
jgi:hypothetical protein